MYVPQWPLDYWKENTQRLDTYDRYEMVQTINILSNLTTSVGFQYENQ